MRKLFVFISILLLTGCSMMTTQAQKNLKKTEPQIARIERSHRVKMTQKFKNFDLKKVILIGEHSYKIILSRKFFLPEVF